MLFSNFLELFIVIHSASACVLNFILKIQQVNHFMNKGFCYLLKWSVKMFSTKIDFILSFIFFITLPGFPRSTPTISTFCNIRVYSDNRLLKFIVKEFIIEGIKKPFKLINYCLDRTSIFFL